LLEILKYLGEKRHIAAHSRKPMATPNPAKDEHSILNPVYPRAC
jgi:hypothetical protein